MNYILFLLGLFVAVINPMESSKTTTQKSSYQLQCYVDTSSSSSTTTAAQNAIRYSATHNSMSSHMNSVTDQSYSCNGTDWSSQKTNQTHKPQELSASVQKDLSCLTQQEIQELRTMQKNGNVRGLQDHISSLQNQYQKSGGFLGFEKDATIQEKIIAIEEHFLHNRLTHDLYIIKHGTLEDALRVFEKLDSPVGTVIKTSLDKQPHTHDPLNSTTCNTVSLQDINLVNAWYVDGKIETETTIAARQLLESRSDYQQLKKSTTQSTAPVAHSELSRARRKSLELQKEHLQRALGRSFSEASKQKIIERISEIDSLLVPPSTNVPTKDNSELAAHSALIVPIEIYRLPKDPKRQALKAKKKELEHSLGRSFSEISRQVIADQISEIDHKLSKKEYAAYDTIIMDSMHLQDSSIKSIDGLDMVLTPAMNQHYNISPEVDQLIQRTFDAIKEANPNNFSVQQEAMSLALQVMSLSGMLVPEKQLSPLDHAKRAQELVALCCNTLYENLRKESVHDYIKDRCHALQSLATFLIDTVIEANRIATHSEIQTLEVIHGVRRPEDMTIPEFNLDLGIYKVIDALTKENIPNLTSISGKQWSKLIGECGAECLKDIVALQGIAATARFVSRVLQAAVETEKAKTLLQVSTNIFPKTLQPNTAQISDNVILEISQGVEQLGNASKEINSSLSVEIIPLKSIRKTPNQKVTEDVVNIVNQTCEAILNNGYYEVNGFKFSEFYYNKLWNEGRKAPSLVAREILDGTLSCTPDTKKIGFFRYECGNWEMVYNPITKEVWHLQPIKIKGKM